MEIKGKCKFVSKEETQVISEKLSKRGFVVELNSEYNTMLYLELFNDRTNLIDNLKEGDWIDIVAFPKSRSWTKDGVTKWFTSLNCSVVKALEENKEESSDLPW